MTRVVLANEMGGGWGHLLPLRAIANEFIQRGCNVLLMCRDCEKAASAFWNMDIAIEQSPAWEVRKAGFSLNYAQCIWGNGYWDEERFRAHVAWWKKRFLALRPDYVLTDYAPTALLAAMSLDLPRGAIGTGFTLPPAATPMPGLHPWFSLPANKFRESENILVERIGRTLPSIQAVEHIFSGAQRYLIIFPETDHYEGSRQEKYWGPVFEQASDRRYLWPSGNGPKVFFYLSAAGGGLKDFIAYVRDLGLPAVGYIRGLSESDRQTMESDTVRISPTPIDITRIASECDLAVTHGGYGTSIRMLHAGKRLLICPEQLEQTLLAHRLHKQGLCEFVGFFSEKNKMKEKFDRIANAVAIRKNVAAFAAKYAGYDATRTVREIVHTCLTAAG